MPCQVDGSVRQAGSIEECGRQVVGGIEWSVIAYVYCCVHENDSSGKHNSWSVLRSDKPKLCGLHDVLFILCSFCKKMYPGMRGVSF